MDRASAAEGGRGQGSQEQVRRDPAPPRLRE